MQMHGSNLQVDQGHLNDELVVILLTKLLALDKLHYGGFKALKDQVARCIAAGQPLKLVLPAFPCKSSNAEKRLGKYPDLAEWLALKRIVSAIRDLEELYEPGVQLTIFSDYHTFAEYIGVDLSDHYSYRDELKTMVHALGCDGTIEIVSLADFPEFSSADEADYSTVLRTLYGDRAFEQKIVDDVKSEGPLNAQYTALRKFMEDDQWPVLKNFGKSERRRTLAETAKGMMIQGRALDAFIREKFPDRIRLSIHEHPLDGKKFSVQLFDSDPWKTPWHNCILFDAASGRFRVGKRSELLANAERNGAIVSTVTFEGRDWLLLQFPPAEPQLAERLRTLKLWLYRRDCGLVVENTGASFDIRDIDKNAITNLIRHFGVVTFRKFDGFERQADLEAWYSTRGDLLRWEFGSTHVVRPELSGDGPTSSVLSEEALPIHWDMVSPPPYMNIDQSLYAYKDFIPREFVLYCKYNSAAECQGLSTIVDSALAPLTINGAVRKALRNTSLAYRTRQSYFGGVERIYPVVMKCPWTDNDVIRWWQAWGEDKHPGSIQHNYSRIASSERFDDVEALEAQLSDICLNESCHFAHEFAQGDIALLNNYTVLHGRTAFHGQRELWRVQLQPPSSNSPWKKSSTVSDDSERPADGERVREFLAADER